MTEKKWAVLFMHTPTGIITDIDYDVADEDIAEYGQESCTGILETHYDGTVKNLDIPELKLAADVAANTVGRKARRDAWKIVQELVGKSRLRMMGMARKRELEIIAETEGYKPGWIFYRLKDEFGYDVAQIICQ